MTQSAKQNSAAVLPIRRYTVVSVHFDKSKEPAALQRALAASRIRLAACHSLDEARELFDRLRPIAGILYFGGAIDAAAMRDAAALMEHAPRLRLIALVEPTLAQAPELAALVAKGLIHDFHTLPICRDRLMFSLGHIAGLVALENSEPGAAAPPAAKNHADDRIVGASASIARVLQQIRKFAEVDAPVLVTGEAGTGKELAARAIHDRSPFRKGPFVAIDCAGLPAGLVNAELFGYERGAFAGAIKQKIGRIETAAGGTLFLDEIGGLPIETQGGLLRLLQQGTIERLGGARPVTADTRVIAATSTGLNGAVGDGRFRGDLHDRLNVLSLDMPPLRERGDDVQLLATYFLRRFAAELGSPKLGFHDGALEKLQRYRWPGNVRELAGTIRRAVVMTEGRWVMAQDVSFPESAEAHGVALPDLAVARRELEHKLVRDALRLNGGNIQRAARELGVSRVTFYRLLEKHGVEPESAARLRNALRRIAPPRRPPGNPGGRLVRSGAGDSAEEADESSL